MDMLDHLRPDTREAVDSLDAAVFSGDEFFNEEARRAFKAVLARWDRALQQMETTGEEIEGEN